MCKLCIAHFAFDLKCIKPPQLWFQVVLHSRGLKVSFKHFDLLRFFVVLPELPKLPNGKPDAQELGFFAQKRWGHRIVARPLPFAGRIWRSWRKWPRIMLLKRGRPNFYRRIQVDSVHFGSSVGRWWWTPWGRWKNFPSGRSSKIRQLRFSQVQASFRHSALYLEVIHRCYASRPLTDAAGLKFHRHIRCRTNSELPWHKVVDDWSPHRPLHAFLFGRELCSCLLRGTFPGDWGCAIDSYSIGDSTYYWPFCTTLARTLLFGPTLYDSGLLSRGKQWTLLLPFCVDAITMKQGQLWNVSGIVVVFSLMCGLTLLNTKYKQTCSMVRIGRLVFDFRQTPPFLQFPTWWKHKHHQKTDSDRPFPFLTLESSQSAEIPGLLQEFCEAMDRDHCPLFGQRPRSFRWLRWFRVTACGHVHWHAMQLDEWTEIDGNLFVVRTIFSHFRNHILVFSSQVTSNSFSPKLKPWPVGCPVELRFHHAGCLPGLKTRSWRQASGELWHEGRVTCWYHAIVVLSCSV